ncbi:MAG: hypothetical protein M1541_22255, partial [Acidobacteria bacterium]|nr:hypothetical protein [Acidobacteriota bacterium]
AGSPAAGLPAGIRKQTQFSVKTYLTSWPNQGAEPGYGPLFRAALGGGPQVFAGGTLAAGTEGRTLCFSGVHGLSAGSAVVYGNEIRFVTTIVDAQTIMLNTPFSVCPTAGSAIGATAGYSPATNLPSVSVFDYWSPGTAVQRLLSGAAVDEMRVTINGDFHEFEFSGLAADLIDSESFNEGQGALSAFPEEPAMGMFDYAVVPGHLGQAWMGAIEEQVGTITSAELVITNNIDLRNREFGSETARGVAGGMRNVAMTFSLYEKDDDSTRALYQAARSRSPISIMFQLGQQQGQLFGLYLKSVIPEVPEFDDSDNRLQWRFTNCRAQGSIDDELYVAFG